MEKAKSDEIYAFHAVRFGADRRNDAFAFLPRLAGEETCPGDVGGWSGLREECHHGGQTGEFVGYL